MKVEIFVVALFLGLAPLCPVSARAQDRYPVRQISKEMHQEGFPSWSPDGKTLVFEDVEPEHYGLFKVTAEGGTPARFTSFIEEHPKWSPDGQYIVFDADFGDSIKLISSHGGRPVRIVPESFHVSKTDTPALSTRQSTARSHGVTHRRGIMRPSRSGSCPMGRTAIVTGASRGIGHAIALALAIFSGSCRRA
jgi:hypothetical protein